MQFYIPTKGRPDEQPAYDQLEEAGLKPVLVVDRSEHDLYLDTARLILTVPDGGIAAKRQHIINHALKQGHHKICVLDDDMEIHAVDKTAVDKATTFRPGSFRLRVEVAAIDELLEVYAHGGIHTRHFVNYAKQPHELNRGYYRQIMFFNLARMPRIPKYVGHTAEDVRFMIALLEQGLDYFIATSCCMKEIKSKVLKTHFTQGDKDKDMRALAAEYPTAARELKDGRVTLSYAKILKKAKKRLDGG